MSSCRFEDQITLAVYQELHGPDVAVVKGDMEARAHEISEEPPARQSGDLVATWASAGVAGALRTQRLKLNSKERAVFRPFRCWVIPCGWSHATLGEEQENPKGAQCLRE